MSALRNTSNLFKWVTASSLSLAFFLMVGNTNASTADHDLVTKTSLDVSKQDTKATAYAADNKEIPSLKSLTRKFISIEEKVGIPVSRVDVNFENNALSFGFANPYNDRGITGYNQNELDALQCFAATFGTLESFSHDPIEDKVKRKNAEATLSNALIVDYAIDLIIKKLDVAEEHQDTFRIGLRNQNFEALKTLIPEEKEIKTIGQINGEIERYILGEVKDQYRQIYRNVPAAGTQDINNRTHHWPYIIQKTQIEYAHQFSLSDEQLSKKDKNLIAAIQPIYEALKLQGAEIRITDAYSIVLDKLLSNYGIDPGKTYPTDGILGENREYEAIKILLEHGVPKALIKDALHETYTKVERTLIMDLTEDITLNPYSNLYDQDLILLADKLNGAGKDVLNLRSPEVQAAYITAYGSGFNLIETFMDGSKYTRKEAKVIHDAIIRGDNETAAQAMTDLSGTGEDQKRLEGQKETAPEYTFFKQ